MSRKPMPLKAPMVITITPTTTREMVEMFPEFLDSNLLVRVSDQHYGEIVSESFRVHSQAAVKTQKGRSMAKQEVTETVLDNGVLDKAMELAEGHPQRIEIIDDKTAIVWNSREQKHDIQAQRVLGRRGRR